LPPIQRFLRSSLPDSSAFAGSPDQRFRTGLTPVLAVTGQPDFRSLPEDLRLRIIVPGSLLSARLAVLGGEAFHIPGGFERALIEPGARPSLPHGVRLRPKPLRVSPQAPRQGRSPDGSPCGGSKSSRSSFQPSQVRDRSLSPATGLILGPKPSVPPGQFLEPEGSWGLPDPVLQARRLFRSGWALLEACRVRFR
jgi:hypothetical protein